MFSDLCKTVLKKMSQKDATKEIIKTSPRELNSFGYQKMLNSLYEKMSILSPELGQLIEKVETRENCIFIYPKPSYVNKIYGSEIIVAGYDYIKISVYEDDDFKEAPSNIYSIKIILNVCLKETDSMCERVMSIHYRKNTLMSIDQYTQSSSYYFKTICLSCQNKIKNIPDHCCHQSDDISSINYVPFKFFKGYYVSDYELKILNSELIKISQTIYNIIVNNAAHQAQTSTVFRNI